MIIVRNNQLLMLDISEDMISDNDFKAIKTLEQLKEEGNRYAIRDEIYNMVAHNDGGVNFQCIQSCYSDNSSLGKFIHKCDTKGELIYKTIGYGYSVYNGNVLLSDSIRRV